MSHVWKKGLLGLVALFTVIGAAIADEHGLAKQLSPEGVQQRKILRQMYLGSVDSQKRAVLFSELMSSHATLLPDGVNERLLPEPMRESLARSASTPLTPFEWSEKASANKSLSTELVVDYTNAQIGNHPVHLRSYNGQLVGPVLRVKAGDTLKITLKNQLPSDPETGHANEHHGWNITNLHFHGLHVAPQGTSEAESDNVFLAIPGPTGSQYYEVHIPDNHVAGTFWYHAHKHGSVSAQVASGLAGALIVERDDDKHNLDDVYAIDNAKEQILVFQQVPYLLGTDGVGVIEKDTVPGAPAVMFGPGTWHSSGHYTTVNGQQLPVLTIAPGELQRWRMIHSGQRESLRLRIVKDSQSTGNGPATIAFHEIALDGLPTGDVEEKETIEMFPGYRSDALVQGPANTGVYFLIDDASPGGESLDGSPEPLKYIAKLVVAGASQTGSLPTTEDVAPHRFDDIDPDEVSGTQRAFYGIDLPPGDVKFLLSKEEDVAVGDVPQGREFDPNDVRELPLGATERWFVGSRNTTDIPPNGQPHHPFHIHVNPFLIAGVVDDTGTPVPGFKPVWRDTLALRQGYTYELLTRYEDFTGEFVQHCHILDHEDQGMMEKIRVVSALTPNGPGPLGGAKSNLISDTLSPSTNKPSVIFFVKGSSCPHCMSQLTEMAGVLAGKDVDVSVVTASSRADLEEFPAVPFRLVADPSGKLFEKHGAVENGETQHATVALSERGEEVFRDVGDEPLMDASELLRSIRPLSSSVKLRLSIDDPQFDLDDFLYALGKLKDAPSSDLMSYETFRRLHNGGLLPNGEPGGCIHGDPNFLPWHRMLLAQFESALQATDPPRTSNVTLPYWDFSRSPTGNRFPEAFEDQASDLWHDNRFNILPTTPQVWKEYAEELEQDRAMIMDADDLKETLFDLDRYRTSDTDIGFSNAIESSPHNWMHTPFTQGDMDDDVTAANDMIFWSFHCYLDQMWYRWQVEHGAFAGSDAKLLPANLAKQYDHFPTPMTVAQVLDPADLGYGYDIEEKSVPVDEMFVQVKELAQSKAVKGAFSWQQADDPKLLEAAAAKPKAVVIVSDVKPNTEDSWALEFFLHPKDAKPKFDDLKFRKMYFAGQHVQWQGSHRPAHPHQDDVMVMLSPKKVLASKSDKREFVLSTNFRLLPRSKPGLMEAKTLEAADAPKSVHGKVSVEFK